LDRRREKLISEFHAEAGFESAWNDSAEVARALDTGNRDRYANTPYLPWGLHQLVAPVICGTVDTSASPAGRVTNVRKLAPVRASALQQQCDETNSRQDRAILSRDA